AIPFPGQTPVARPGTRPFAALVRETRRGRAPLATATAGRLFRAISTNRVGPGAAFRADRAAESWDGPRLHATLGPRLAQRDRTADRETRREYRNRSLRRVQWAAARSHAPVSPKGAESTTPPSRSWENRGACEHFAVRPALDSSAP